MAELDKELEEAARLRDDQVAAQERLFAQKEARAKNIEKVEILETIVDKREEEALRAAEANKALVDAQRLGQQDSKGEPIKFKKIEEEIEPVPSGGRGYVKPVNVKAATKEVTDNMDRADEACSGMYAKGAEIAVTFTDEAATMTAGRFAVAISNDDDGNPVYHRNATDHRGILEESRMLVSLEHAVTGVKNLDSVGYETPQNEKSGQNLSVSEILTGQGSAIEKTNGFMACTMAVAAASMDKPVTVNGEAFGTDTSAFKAMAQEVTTAARNSDMREELLAKGRSGLKPVQAEPKPAPTVDKEVQATVVKKNEVMAEKVPRVEATEVAEPRSEASSKAKSVLEAAPKPAASAVVERARENVGAAELSAGATALRQEAEKAAAAANTAPRSGGSGGGK